MSDELDLKVLQLELAQLRKEIERLDKEKFPHGNKLQRYLFQIFFSLMFVAAMFQWLAMFGYQTVHGKFFYANVEATLRAGDVRIEDRDNPDSEYGHFGFSGGRPDISLVGGEKGSVDIDAEAIRLEGKRGILILELNEKGEPVLRSIPAKK